MLKIDGIQNLQNMDPSIEVRGKYVEKDVNSFYANELNFAYFHTIINRYI